MIFKPAARYPADPRVVFVLALSVLTGFMALLIDAAPELLEGLMPQWALFTWGATMALGSLVTLIGIGQNSLLGIIMEQVGSVMVSATTLFYSGVAVWTVGFHDSLPSTGLVFAWGVACALRWVQLQMLINQAYKQKLKDEAKRHFLRDLDLF